MDEHTTEYSLDGTLDVVVRWAEELCAQSSPPILVGERGNSFSAELHGYELAIFRYYYPELYSMEVGRVLGRRSKRKRTKIHTLTRLLPAEDGRGVKAIEYSGPWLENWPEFREYQAELREYLCARFAKVEQGSKHDEGNAGPARSEEDLGRMLVDAVLVMRQHHGWGNVETAKEIMDAVPQAVRRHEVEGGRWGPGMFAPLCNKTPATIGRYLKAFREVGLTETLDRFKLPGPGVKDPY